jgi:inosine/xanthosine triphosphatase
VGSSPTFGTLQKLSPQLMTKITIGTQNKRKIETVRGVIQELVPALIVEIESYPAQSGVSETPWERETYEGAKNRAVDAKSNTGQSEYYIGLESGLVERYGQVYEEAWACVIRQDGTEYYGYSSGLKVPDYITDKMKSMNLEHFQVMELLEKEHELPHSDTWGNYSKEMIIRDISLQEAVRNALVPLFSPKESFYHK